ncbi:hypothetical protein [uncultured Thiothrix sp.]|uniref:hypothetical protein n=1 Tax=uncultured Thiothrix sp. TaxID=223185 RepID=UPI002620AEC9|nr:hypothetical protein [uncultured Thiothrix sp.]HMT93963.1 hypothetical protein [Thiolinea sp.]
MFALSPSQTLTFTLMSAAVLALVFTWSVAKNHRIPNPMFSLARALASFVATWLLWGSISGAGNDMTANTQIGLIPYLTLEYTKLADQWMAEAMLNWGRLSLTIALTGLILFGLSFVFGRLAAISDRRH